MWVLDYKESWALKNWCFWTVVLQKTLESPLNCKEILKEISREYSAEAETTILWPPDLFEKTMMLGKIEGGRKKGQQGTR